MPLFARISGAESEKAKEILKGSQAKLYDTVDEAIHAVVKEVSKERELNEMTKDFDIFDILIGKENDKDYKKKSVIIQGITGSYGSTHTRLMKAYGTNIVAGVTPGKEGQNFEGIPVYNSVAKAVKASGARISGVFVPANFFLDGRKRGIR